LSTISEAYTETHHPTTETGQQPTKKTHKHRNNPRKQPTTYSKNQASSMFSRRRISELYIQTQHSTYSNGGLVRLLACFLCVFSAKCALFLQAQSNVWAILIFSTLAFALHNHAKSERKTRKRRNHPRKPTKRPNQKVEAISELS